jgi:hypothetical protein
LSAWPTRDRGGTIYCGLAVIPAVVEGNAPPTVIAVEPRTSRCRPQGRIRIRWSGRYATRHHATDVAVGCGPLSWVLRGAACSSVGAGAVGCIPISEMSSPGSVGGAHDPSQLRPCPRHPEAPARSRRRVDAAGPALGGDADHLGVRFDLQRGAAAGPRRRSSQLRGRRGSVRPGCRRAGWSAGHPWSRVRRSVLLPPFLAALDPAPDRIWDHLG